MTSSAKILLTGFEEGFSDYLTYGGDGLTPVMPPRRYWRFWYTSPAGYDAVTEWFNGWDAGVAAAEMSGLREFATVPSSLIMGGAILDRTDGQLLEPLEEVPPPGDYAPWVDPPSGTGPPEPTRLAPPGNQLPPSELPPPNTEGARPRNVPSLTVQPRNGLWPTVGLAPGASDTNLSGDHWQIATLPGLERNSTGPSATASPAPLDAQPYEPSPSDRLPNGQLPNGQLPNGQLPNGQLPSGPSPYNLQPAGQPDSPELPADQQRPAPDFGWPTFEEPAPAPPLSGGGPKGPAAARPVDSSLALYTEDANAPSRIAVRPVGYTPEGYFEQAYETIVGLPDAEPVRDAVFFYSPDDPLNGNLIPPAVLRANAFDAEQPMSLPRTPQIFSTQRRGAQTWARTKLTIEMRQKFVQHNRVALAGRRQRVCQCRPTCTEASQCELRPPATNTTVGRFFKPSKDGMKFRPTIRGGM